MKANFFSKSFLIAVILWFTSSLHSTIPISHIKGVDELFVEQFQIYSPLTGLLHHGTTLPIWFSQLESPEAGKENLNKLVSTLFVLGPNKNILPSHIASNPAANLSGGTIAKLLIELDYYQQNPKNFQQDAVAQRLLDLITSDNGYQENLREAKLNMAEVLQAQEQFESLVREQEKQTKEATKFKKQHLGPVVRELRELKKQGLEATEQFLNLNQKKIELEAQCEAMTAGFLNKIDKAAIAKSTNRRISHLQTEDDIYKDKLHNLADLLAKSFLQYDLKADPSISEEITHRYQHATVITLLSFIWMTYDNKLALKAYLEIMAQAGFLTQTSWPDTFYESYYTEADYKAIKSDLSICGNKSKWICKNVTDSIAMSMDSSYTDQNELMVPEHVPFSYANWVKYNPMFADCTENAVHNIFNLIAFNPRTGLYDGGILQKLKDEYYPDFDQRVINFYNEYSAFSQHNQGKIKKKWITFVSNLNDNLERLPKDQKIKYARVKSEANSDYLNIIKIVNKLMGYSDITKDNMIEIFSRVKEVSGMAVNYSILTKPNSHIEQEEFQTGGVTFRLTSYGSAHCIFSKKYNSDQELIQKIKNTFYDKAMRKRKDREVFRYNSIVNYLTDGQKNQ
ncbi:MAG TPA: hypothetical protein VEL47_03590 [Myxococcota bacterium]|nr:hypothetical protein [Myxococcota bacterium]